MQPAILIVDDEPHLLRLLVRVFERAGYPVLSSGDATKACEFIDDSAAAIAALVLDAGIAPVGADAVLARVLDRRTRIGVVLVSGDHLSPELAVWIASNGGRFLRKPFLPAALIEAVRGVIDATHPVTQ
jgi:two-component system KDP operon response regulator KdpE